MKKEAAILQNNLTMGKVILCGCEQSHKINSGHVAELRKQLDDQGHSYTYVNDLCGLSVVERENLAKEFSQPATVLACEPRAVRWLLHSAGIDSRSDFVSCINIQNALPDDQVNALHDSANTCKTLEYNDNWKPWFPVIDYDLCSGCKKCVDFCLFGVYSINGKNGVTVNAPSSCKDQCPACARVCPTQAIIFPKSSEGTIGGEELSHEFNQGADFEEIMSDGVYEALAARRNRSKLTLLKKQQREQAEQERTCCSAPKNDPLPQIKLPLVVESSCGCNAPVEKTIESDCGCNAPVQDTANSACGCETTEGTSEQECCSGEDTNKNCTGDCSTCDCDCNCEAPDSSNSSDCECSSGGCC